MDEEVVRRVGISSCIPRTFGPFENGQVVFKGGRHLMPRNKKKPFWAAILGLPTPFSHVFRDLFLVPIT